MDDAPDLARIVATTRAIVARAGALRAVVLLDRGEDAEPVVIDCVTGGDVEVAEGEEVRTWPGDDEAEILTRMVTAFDAYANQIGLPAAAAALNLTPYEVVTTASMVEREARVDEDRAPIARVIYNRIKKGMPLQIDATVQYALGGTKPRLSNADLKVDSPYNTYLRVGLTPTPISMPGKVSLQAAARPAQSKAHYFVSRGDGSSEFSEDLGSHNRAVTRYQRKVQ